MNIEYQVNGRISGSEIIDVFQSVGWNKKSDDIVEAFKNSYYITAYDNGKLIGFSRAISDNYYYTSIFDVVIRPEYRYQGIAKQMMTMIKEKFAGTYFFLTYTEENRDFYLKCGFEDNSSAMWIPK